MKKEGKFQTTLIVMLAIAVVAMSVGFAAFSTSLNINGTATFEKAKWSVHFKTGAGALVTTGTTIPEENPARFSQSVTDTTLTFNADLKYGEKYVVEGTIINDGTMNAKLTTITFGGTFAGGTTPKAVNEGTYGGVGGANYHLYVNGTEYTENQTGLAVALNTEGTHTVKVELEYAKDTSTDGSGLKITSNSITGTLTVTLVYEEA